MFEVGSKVKFKGYSTELEESEKVYSAGDVLTVKGVDGEGEDVEYTVTNGSVSSEVYAEEIEEHEEELDLDLAEPEEEKEDIDVVGILTGSDEVEVSDMGMSEVFDLSKEETLKRAKDLVDNINKSYFKLGQVMSSIYQDLMYEDLGYEGSGGFKRYCEDELGFNHERIMHCMRIFNNLHRTGVSAEQISDMSYTKAIHVARAINEANKDILLEFATDTANTVADVRRFISDNYVEDEDDELEAKVETEGGIHKETFKFQFDIDRAQLVHSILAKGDADFDCKGNNNDTLFNVLMAYADTVEGVELPVDQAMRAFNSKYNTNFTMQDINRSREQV